MMIKIVPFKTKYAPVFRDLNLAWLKKYFHVEPKDQLLLENCQKHIIDKGGYIFIALLNEQPVGCFSLMPTSTKIYELGKMAVSHKYQGKSIGQQLMAFAIAFAQQQNWDKIILYSSTKLPTALYIYKKYDFKTIELEKDLPYARSDIKMELNLTNN
ncbi:GNAT family N-acetyltransferase [Maribacter sp. R77961]|uniref:GNAT family N-acetyltransferase n=1 Tax=Maribacter sp. R77961 TaxID=3093871 RepID=UPI0037C73C08